MKARPNVSLTRDDVFDFSDLEDNIVDETDNLSLVELSQKHAELEELRAELNEQAKDIEKALVENRRRLDKYAVAIQRIVGFPDLEAKPPIEVRVKKPKKAPAPEDEGITTIPFTPRTAGEHILSCMQPSRYYRPAEIRKWFAVSNERVSSQRISYALKKLKNEGRLEHRGFGRRSRYRLPGKSNLRVV